MALTAIVVYLSALQASIQQELLLRAQRPHSCGLLFAIAVNLEADRASCQRGARPLVAVKPELMMQVLPCVCEQFVSCSAALSDDFRFSRALEVGAVWVGAEGLGPEARGDRKAALKRMSVRPPRAWPGLGLLSLHGLAGTIRQWEK